MKKKPVYSVTFHIPLYFVDICVIVGARSKEDVLGQFKKQKINAEVTKRWMEDKHLPKLLTQDAGSLVHGDELAVIYVFKDWKDDWKHYEILIHEISHMVDSIAECKNFMGETEAKAYLFEYIFRTLRKSL